jgi:hypothetical protein
MDTKHNLTFQFLPVLLARSTTYRVWTTTLKQQPGQSMILPGALPMGLRISSRTPQLLVLSKFMPSCAFRIHNLPKERTSCELPLTAFITTQDIGILLISQKITLMSTPRSKAGYSIFTYDRLGAGQSDHPNADVV